MQEKSETVKASIRLKLRAIRKLDENRIKWVAKPASGAHFIRNLLAQFCIGHGNAARPCNAGCQRAPPVSAPCRSTVFSRSVKSLL